MSISKHLVLIVEDEPRDADLVRDLLSDLPLVAFELVHAESLDAALGVLGTARVDAVLLDLNLTDSWGLDTLRAVKPRARSAPVIVVSGILNDELKALAVAAGADDVLDKSIIDSKLFSRSLLYVIERNRAREQHGHVESLLDATPDAIIVTSERGRVRYVNRAAQKLFGRSAQDFVGDLLGFSVKVGDVSEITLPGDPHRTCEMRVVDFDWRDERGHLAIIRDVTQQRKLDTQLMMSDRLISLGTLAAGVAHEINNPLTSVLTNLSLALEEAPITASLRSKLSDAHEAAVQIQHVVRDIGIFSRTDEETYTPFDVHRALDTMARMARSHVGSKARLVKDYGDVPRVLGNESQLSQVFLNILVNAAQAITQGSVASNEIRIGTRQLPDGRVGITFADTGCGISPAVRSRIFTPFFTTKPIGTGTGLGLAICQQIVSSHDGEIWVDSQVGVGSRFTVVLPAAADDASLEPSSQVGPPLRLPVVQGRVLVVDDEVTVGRSIRRALRYEHEVIWLPRAADAIEALRSGQRFDVILCDLMMPELDGTQFAAALNELGASVTESLVFISGGAPSERVRGFLANNRYTLLSKPFALDELRSLIARRIESYRALSSLPPRPSGTLAKASSHDSDSRELGAAGAGNQDKPS